MATKKGKRRDAHAPKPKQLREQLHKAEAGLHQAEAKRDRAQARVEALGIIADEIRAQLADIEKADAKTGAQPGPEAEPGQDVSPEVEAEPKPGPKPKPSAPPRPRRTQKAQPTT